MIFVEVMKLRYCPTVFHKILQTCYALEIWLIWPRCLKGCNKVTKCINENPSLNDRRLKQINLIQVNRNKEKQINRNN